MLGRLLCKLGLHQPIITVMGERSGGQFTSAFGFCARDGCWKPYQFDH